MAYDEATAARVRELLAERDDVVENQVVGGGRGFMVGDHLCVIVGDVGLTVRVGAEGKAAALAEPHVRPHTIGARETAAFVVVEPPGYAGDLLAGWLGRALGFVASLE